jgi:hypothetical protein
VARAIDDGTQCGSLHPREPDRGAARHCFTRRHTARLTGRQPERTIKPHEIYGHMPGLLRVYGSLEQATAKLQ